MCENQSSHDNTHSFWIDGHDVIPKPGEEYDDCEYTGLYDPNSFALEEEGIVHPGADTDGYIPDSLHKMPDLNENKNEDGISVKLGDRAVNLASAIRAGGKYNSAVAYESSLRVKKPKREYEDAIKRTVTREKLFRKQFYEAFYRAIGLEAVVAAGYDPDLALSEANTMAMEFKNTYLGPKNKHAREKYRKVLENFQK